jgi:hypothetical protein
MTLRAGLVRILPVALLTARPMGARQQAQPAWQADIRIEALQVTRTGSTLVGRVIVTSDNGADALGAHLDLLLPIGATITQLVPGCRAGSGNQGVVGLVSCDLGTLPVRSVRVVTVAATIPATSGPARLGAFVRSDTPDPVPANNYADRAATP